MNKLETGKGKHRLIVLPFQPQDPEAFSGIGLTMHFLLGNVVAINSNLKEFWFGWRINKLFPKEKDLNAFTRGRLTSLNFEQLGQEQGIRFWLYGRAVDDTASLSLYDSEDKEPPVSTRISFSFDDDLIGFRMAFIDWLEECGLPFPPARKISVSWPEKMTPKGADIFGRALEVFYAYTAYGGPNQGNIDLAPFMAAAAASPASFMAQNLLGWAHYRNMEYKPAKEAFLRALQINQDAPGVMSGLMWCGVYTKHEKEALSWASRKAVLLNQDVDKARQKTLERLKKAHPA